jgi:cell division transport system permease protein
MIITNLKRIIRAGFVNFWRNGFLSFAAVVVITLSLSAFGGLIFASAFMHSLLADVKDKVDVNVYFTLTAQESDILSLQKELQALPEVQSVQYVSADQALSDFKAKWQDNALIMQGLDEVGSNPFPASLNIMAKDPGQYGNIANFLTSKNAQDDNGNPIIDKVNYQENKLVIDRLTAIIPTVEESGLAIALIFVFVAIIIVWNTIRLVIYTARDEIAVMKLVGASNVYVRGPFVVSGIMYGVVSATLTLVLMAAFAYWSDAIVLKVAGLDVAANFSLIVNVLSAYFIANFAEIFAIIMGSGILLGGVSSYIAAKRYLRI